MDAPGKGMKALSYERLRSFGRYENEKIGKIASFPVDKPDEECIAELEEQIALMLHFVEKRREKREKVATLFQYKRRIRELEEQLDRVKKDIAAGEPDELEDEPDWGLTREEEVESLENEIRGFEGYIAELEKQIREER